MINVESNANDYDELSMILIQVECCTWMCARRQELCQDFQSLLVGNECHFHESQQYDRLINQNQKTKGSHLRRVRMNFS